jgi:hypothetical protein
LGKKTLELIEKETYRALELYKYRDSVLIEISMEILNTTMLCIVGHPRKETAQPM